MMERAAGNTRSVARAEYSTDADPLSNITPLDFLTIMLRINSQFNVGKSPIRPVNILLVSLGCNRYIGR